MEEPRPPEGFLARQLARWRQQWEASETEPRPILDEAGEYVGRVSIFRDVHVEVENRRKLAESEEWYRLLVENVTDFVTMASPDGRFTWASPSVARSTA